NSPLYDPRLTRPREKVYSPENLLKSVRRVFPFSRKQHGRARGAATFEVRMRLRCVLQRVSLVDFDRYHTIANHLEKCRGGPFQCRALRIVDEYGRPRGIQCALLAELGQIQGRDGTRRLAEAYEHAHGP